MHLRRSELAPRREMFECVVWQQKFFRCDRDTKPANVLMPSEGSCKLTDFGECRKVLADLEVSRRTTLTEAMCLFPEACRGDTVKDKACPLTVVWARGIALREKNELSTAMAEAMARAVEWLDGKKPIKIIKVG